MAQEIINIGTLPNDGEGDPLRVAFAKINNNFSSLYSTATVTSEGSTVGTTPNQVVWQVPVVDFTQGQLQVLSGNPVTNDSQNLIISAHVTYDQTAVKWTGYATTFNGTAVATYDMDVNSGNVRLLVTPLVSDTLQHFVAIAATVSS
jgi:hypothetical protein